ncbi:MAG: V-type ATP synthase subunit F [Gemmatimonadaceae bacterium]
MSAVRVVGRPGACAGFALAGIPVAEVDDVQSTTRLLATLTARSDIGVVLVEQDLLDALAEADRRALLRRATPIVVPFPGPAWAEVPTSADAYVLELLRRAIGYRVRLR